jgi:hypothetical protein
MGWLDSPELVAAAASLGVAHSPGHPLAGMLGHLACLLPVGDVAFRVALLSSLCGAAAVAALTIAGSWALGGGGGPAPWTARALSGAVALIYGSSWAAWHQAVRAEVYALQSVLLIGLLGLLIGHDQAPRDRRYLLGGALVAGVAAAHHHFMALAVIGPVAGAVLLGRERPSARALCAALVLGLLGMASWLYLPVRAAAGPVVNWAAPTTAGRFVWTVTAQAFQKAASTEHVSSPGTDAVEIVLAAAHQLTPALLVAALLGCYLGLRAARTRRVSLALIAVAGTSGAGRVLIGFDPGTADHHAYLLPGLAAVALLGLMGVARAVRIVSSGRTAAMFAAAAVASLVPWQLGRHAGQATLARAYAADVAARAELEPLPPGAVVLASYFQTSFRLWALRAVDQLRPDVVVLDRSFFTYPGFAEAARARHPDLAPVLAAPLRAGAPTPVTELRALGRPVAIELHPNLEPEVEPWLVPRGAYAWLADQPPSPADRRRAEAVDQRERAQFAQALLAAAAEPADRAGAREALVWSDFVRGGFYCRVGRVEAGAQALRRAAALAPQDDTLAALTRSCGAQPLELPGP